MKKVNDFKEFFARKGLKNRIRRWILLGATKNSYRGRRPHRKILFVVGRTMCGANRPPRRKDFRFLCEPLTLGEVSPLGDGEGDVGFNPSHPLTRELSQRASL